MNAFDRLDDVRNAARARAQESLCYFAQSVLGARVDSALCDRVQRDIENGTPCEVDKRFAPVLNAWLVVTGHVDPKAGLLLARSETLEWLFGAEIAA